MPVAVVAPRCRRHRPADPTCPACRTRKRSQAARREAAVRAGTWEYRQPTGPVAEHCRALREAGKPYKAQAVEAGVSRLTVQGIVLGWTATVEPGIAAALLALRPPDGACPDLVDACGTRRRLRGLARAGWPFADVAARLNVDTDTVGRWTASRHVPRTVADKVAALADELCGLDGPSPRSAVLAAARHRRVGDWWPLEAWGDDIDDPNALPIGAEPARHHADVDEVAVARACRGEVPVAELTRAEKIAAVARLAVDARLSDRRIADRLRWGPDLNRAAEAAAQFRRRHHIPTAHAHNRRGAR